MKRLLALIFFVLAGCAHRIFGHLGIAPFQIRLHRV
jgi:hypothetical protein